jgi:hypothetical protein
MVIDAGRGRANVSNDLPGPNAWDVGPASALELLLLVSTNDPDLLFALGRTTCHSPSNERPNDARFFDFFL